MSTLLPPTNASLTQLEISYAAAVNTAAHCRKLQHAVDMPKARSETYEHMANNAARKATRISQRIDLMLKAQQEKRMSCRETDEFLAAWK